MRVLSASAFFFKTKTPFRTAVVSVFTGFYLLCLLAGSGEAVYFVDDLGLDTNPGSRILPFKTIQKAADCMMTNAASVTCYVFPGVYPEKVTVRSNRNSGFLVFTPLSNTVAPPVMNGSLQSNFAFKITNTSRVVLSGLTIMKYTNGIVLSGRATNNRILGSVLYSNNYYGVFMASDNADKNYIQGNHFWGGNQNHGVCITNGDNNTIRSNLFRRNQNYGIYLCGTATGNSMARNTIYSNFGIAVNSDTADNNFVLTNTIRGIGASSGIYIGNADNITVRSNKVSRYSLFGIQLDGSASGNIIVNNTIYSNSQTGLSIQSDTADNNMVLSNDVWSMNQQFGIYLSSCDNTVVRYNRIHHNQIFGIYIIGSIKWNLIAQNSICSNDRYGIYIGSSYVNTNSVFSNTFSGWNQDFGLYIRDGTKQWIYNNLFNRSQSNAICLVNSTNIKIYNNTIFGSLNDGVLAISSSATLNNNIILSNGNGAGDYGVRRTGALPVYLAHNCLYGNYSGATNGGCILEIPNFTGNPFLETVSSFTIASRNSPAIDTGKVIPGYSDLYQGDAPDLGCRESSYNMGPFYVDDSTGNDLYNGTFGAPFRTIQRAVNRLSPGRNISSATCYIYPGNYPEQVLIASNRNPGFMALIGYSNSAPAPLMDGALPPASNYAFKLTNTSRVVLSGLNIRNYQRGVWLWTAASNNRIMNSVFFSNRSGIVIWSDDADNNLVQGNTVHYSPEYAVRVMAGDGNTIRSNRLCFSVQRGIDIYGSATGNLISKNLIYSNFGGIVLNDNTANGNYFIGNTLWGWAQQQYGIGIWDGNNNLIRSNRLHHHAAYGVRLSATACSNFIERNLIYSNAYSGILVEPSANNNIIASNRIWGLVHDYGIRMAGAADNRIFRNLFERIQNNAIRLSNCNNIGVFNNTIFKAQDDGVYANSSTATLYNNIIMSNGTGSADFGVQRTNGGSIYLGNNILYNNYLGRTNGGILWGPGNSFDDPLLDTGSTFTITSADSAAVDCGRQIPGVTESYQGSAPDMGWLESSFSSPNGPFYVDDDSGDDYFPGTFTKPFRTIQRAVNRMRSGVNVSSATCYIFPGVYREKVTVMSNKNPGFMVINGLSNTPPVLDGSLATNFAFKLTNTSRVFIFGLSIKRFVNGILLRGAAASNVIHALGIYSNTMMGIGIYSENADRNLVRGNNIWGTAQDYGIYIQNGDENSVRSNQVHNNESYGIYLFQSATLNNIRQNTFYGNSDSGLYMNSDTVKDNFIIANGFRGPGQTYAVRFSDSDRNTIMSNTVCRSVLGIVLGNSASSNLIADNSIYSNSDPGVWINSPTADGNRILHNEFWGQSDDPGISLSDGDQNLVRANRCRNNQYYGIMIYGNACSNYIRNNSLYSNGSTGLWILGDEADNNLIFSNMFPGGGQFSGIKINQGDENRIFRNLFNRNQTNIILANVTNTRICNNVIFGSSGAGVFANNSTATLLNNIILSNNSYGVQQAGVSTVFLGYNDLYGNVNGPTNGGILWGAGNISDDPLVDTAGAFVLLSRSSPCVDTGAVIAGVSDIYLNAGPDMGWKEFFYDFTPPSSTADKESGFYSSPFQVTLTGTDPESPDNVTIYYTLDGSDPVSSPTRLSSLSPVTVAVNNTVTLKFYAVNLAGLAEEKVNVRQYDFMRIPQEAAAVYNNLLNLSKGEKALIVFGKAGSAEIRIYTVRGVLVRSWSRRSYSAGDAVEWDGTVNDTGRRAGSGIYFAALRGDINITLKIIIVK